jgi:hypothetical protein
LNLAQIITASLGGVSGWAEDPLAIVVNRIASTGVSCTLAAGNSGSNGKKLQKVLSKTNNILTLIRIILHFFAGNQY